jgi:adenylate cyclase
MTDDALLHSYRLRIEELQDEVEQLKRTIEENEKKHRLTMGRYVTSDVMGQLAARSDATIAGERRKVTMMITDLRRSTELSESMEAEDYLRLLNHYLEQMILIVDGWFGNILGFAGDSIVAVYGAPQDNPDAAKNAVYAAVSMQRHMPKVNEWNRKQGYPQIEMGIGIHTGDAIVGCIGSETRMKYDMIGRNVNLAARVEGYTTGGQILITDETLAAAGDEVIVHAEGEMIVRPKGIRDMVRLHDVVGMGALRLPRAGS